ncbi:beta-lactamase family protein [Phragmitibacter flavus]|uniref:Beta-lactamase family protein n=1 Tax=Phragmitibacter flavus TaxID=2576071 RepID=A0A5R8KAH2_9BACT|nr:serine hydrolase domain-containing protein [Phragmitibacter flavus]TLD69294.1 beta-lactamase family protein [Phragmitibacter flavus]
MPPTTADLLAALTPEFERNFSERNELGASISIHHRGVEILNLSHGIANPADQTPWTADTLVPVWSATKGPAAVATLHALHTSNLTLDQPVAHLWPDFAKAGKSTITFAQLLSHNGGLSPLDEKVSIEDFDAVIQTIENQTPNSAPGTQQAYHARTFGFLLDQIVRLATSAPTLGHYFDETFRRPMNLDFWIGLPSEQSPRVAQLQPAKIKAGTQPDAFMKAFTQPGSLTQRTFASPTGLGSVRDLNRPEIQQLGLASFGGVGSARGLSAFYAMLANKGQWQDQTLVPSTILTQLETTLSQQTDAVLQSPVAFAAGVMRDPVNEDGQKTRQIYSLSPRAFGHPGAGGSLAFADPARQLSFAYVMNQMETGALPNEKSLSLIRLLDQIWPA